MKAESENGGFRQSKGVEEDLRKRKAKRLLDKTAEAIGMNITTYYQVKGAPIFGDFSQLFV